MLDLLLLRLRVFRSFDGRGGRFTDVGRDHTTINVLVSHASSEHRVTGAQLWEYSRYVLP